jgi:D-beta-D-heptose 7-phosphate kinase/D-beta-D-heptose 1-phosphate adenosyltransferase
MNPLPAERAAAIAAAMSGHRVLVVGDVMLDEFVWGRVSRISPEAPVPVVEVTGRSAHLGGAGNVAANVRALGGDAVLAGVVGGDEAGARVRAELAARGVHDRLLDAGSARRTTLKTRIVAHGQQVVRADQEDADELPRELEARLADQAARELRGASALVVSDYQKGVVTERLLRRLLRAARAARVPVLVDPKPRHFRRYRGVTVVTPNQPEAEQVTGLRLDSDARLAAAGRRMLALLGCRAVLLTRGEHGISLFERGKAPQHVPAVAREVFDVTGAGDSVIATLALALAAGATLGEAAVLANTAAGVVVGKLGTAQASQAELLTALRLASRRTRARAARGPASPHRREAARRTSALRRPGERR